MQSDHLNIDPLIFRVEGVGGSGGSVVGEILARSAARAGYHIQCSRAFPAEIKGGRAWFQLTVSSFPQTWWGGAPSLEMTDGKGGDWIISIAAGTNGAVKAEFSPLTIAKGIGQPRSANLVALGFLSGTLRLDLEIVNIVAEKRLSRRGEGGSPLADVINAGYAEAERTPYWPIWNVPAPTATGRKLVMNGNEAIALGALAAGVRFFCGYPITPASSILELMLRELPKLGGTAIQMEDEMAALAACLGASFAGKKAMVATSGPGFALMSELMNLAVMAELPITIVDVQRSGPATGQPSKSEQADLLYALHGSPGDSPRLVLAPATVEEALQMTIEAVNLAERYQMPVILLSDAALSNRIEAVSEPDWERLPVVTRSRPPADRNADFERYLMTPSGVHDIPIPGRDDLPYVAAGMEHSESGAPSASAEAHHRMGDKRLAKVADAGEVIDSEPSYDGLTPGAAVGIVGWGSTLGAITEAVRRLNSDGIRAASAHVRHLNPLPEEQLRRWMKPLRRVIVAEENRSGQLAGLIRHLAPGKIESLLPESEFELTPELVVNAVQEGSYHVPAKAAASSDYTERP